MGTPEMRFSLTSRDIIADSIEAAMGGHVDAAGHRGCDKNMPGLPLPIWIIPASLYGGTIGSRESRWKDIDLVSVFEDPEMEPR